MPAQDPFGERGHDPQPVGVDVVQHELVDRQHAGPAGEALDQLGGVRAAAADDGDPHANAFPRWDGVSP